jgi:hypothetical protein
MSIFAKSVNIAGRLSNTIGPSESLHSPEFCRITGVLQTDQIVTRANRATPAAAAKTVQEFVQERAHFCSRSDKQKKFVNWGDLPR